MKDGMGILLGIMFASIILLMGLSGVLFYREFTGNRFNPKEEKQYVSTYNNDYKTTNTTTTSTPSSSSKSSNDSRTSEEVLASIEAIGSDTEIDTVSKAEIKEDSEREERNKQIMEEVKEKYEDKSSNVGYYSLGEEVIIKTQRGDIKAKITGVRETNVRNEYSDKNPKRIIVIAVTYENISVQDKISVNDVFFDAYDSNGTSLRTYPTIDIPKSPDYVSAGRNSNGEFAYGLDSDVNLIELEVNTYGLLKPYTFRITW